MNVIASTAPVRTRSSSSAVGLGPHGPVDGEDVDLVARGRQSLGQHVAGLLGPSQEHRARPA